MPRADGCDIADSDWARLLARDPADAGLSDLYGPLIAARDCVLGRTVQSLDGRIATAGGSSFWIGGPEDILHTHRLRALFDAVVVGAGTVRADDPLLTTRHCTGPSPVRVVIDTDRRLAADRRMFAGGPATLLLCADDCGGALSVGDATVVRLPRSPAGGVEVAAAVAALAERGLRRLMVEGGGITVSRFLAAGAFDRLHVTVAPLLLGDGVPAFTLPPVARPEDGLRLAWTMHRLGADVLFDIAVNRARPPACA
jgi:riboflavin-specific deaminase-like protein